MSSKEIVVPITVRSYELDIYGHVNNAIYMNYLEYARVQSLTMTGTSFVEYMKKNIFIIVAQANMTFKNPAYLDNHLDIINKIIKVGHSSVTMQQQILNRTRNEETLNAEVTMVFLDQNRKTIPVSEQFLDQLGWKQSVQEKRLV